ncbi:hypothetical protein FVEG_03137 [Fusarium verticillioides 7600]|uniref:Uncharacterized protein n=1 Tax=Gibberella moniliformis (strain M3125 / FGSC 7600) TaxID=334819 RepID=W7M7P3_GIBM7|nr:hypothetical protein FVEG_03137 [Fusarium verticillioides 7600]EWG40907.1 hypothetical protein FVEG_03137 [Fusarium verticillioides 7600]
MVNHNAAQKKPAEPVLMNPAYISLECKRAKSFMSGCCPRVSRFLVTHLGSLTSGQQRLLPLIIDASFLYLVELSSTMDQMTLPSTAPTHNEREEAAQILTDMSDQGPPQHPQAPYSCLYLQWLQKTTLTLFDNPRGQTATGAIKAENSILTSNSQSDHIYNATQIYQSHTTY